jgi:dCMP deaminase
MEDIWMEVAVMLSKRSTCERLQIGCVITSLDLRRVFSNGYNGGAAGQENECESLEPGNCGHIHAEVNAMILANTNEDASMFVTTFPCKSCSKLIVNKRTIRSIYYRDEYRNNDARKIIETANIIIKKI